MYWRGDLSKAECYRISPVTGWCGDSQDLYSICDGSISQHHNSCCRLQTRSTGPNLECSVRNISN